MRANSLDVYAAFDFFVTVRHLPDWLHPGDRIEQKQRRGALFDKHVELRVARHIADEAKHLKPRTTNIFKLRAHLLRPPIRPRAARSSVMRFRGKHSY